MSRYLGLPDAFILILGSLGGIYGYLIFLTVNSANLLYLGFIDVFRDAIPVGTRSIISKCVEPDELGKAMACLSFCFSLVGLLSPTAGFIYSATVDWYEGFIYCMASTVFIIMAFIGIGIFFLQRTGNKKSKQEEKVE